jgi:CRISPR-associated exonuclease Cas4
MEWKAMSYTEDDLIPLSALQHVVFCERQCALIHVEQVWDENLFTAQGRIMHDRAHEGSRESRGDIRIERGVPLRSLKLGLIGKADVVEFHRTDEDEWQPFPVEYKRGKPKVDDCDKVQLCAQAMCLEEMLDVKVPSGALFYGKTRHRLVVSIDHALREETEKAVRKAREMIRKGVTPQANYTKKCKSCSLQVHCMPKLQKKRSVKTYLTRMVEEL